MKNIPTPHRASLTPQPRTLASGRTWSLSPMSALAQQASALSHATLSMRIVNRLAANNQAEIEGGEIYGDDGLPIPWPTEPRDEDEPTEFVPAPSYHRVSYANASCASRASI